MKGPSEHSHLADLAEAKAKQLVSNMKNDASHTSHTTKAIIGTSLIGVSKTELAKLPTLGTLQRKVCRTKNLANQFPIEPSNRNFDIPEEYATNIIYDTGRDDENRILAIGDRAILDQVGSEEWFSDGTFAKIPLSWYQLYTIHCKIGAYYIPFIYFLLPNKRRETYEKAFRIVKDHVSIIPKRIIMDFEKAAHQAFNVIYPEVPVSGCFFSFKSVCHSQGC